MRDTGHCAYGEKVSVDTVASLKLADGKVVEIFEVVDNLDLLQQLGVIEKEQVSQV